MMKSYMDQLERLGSPYPQDLAIDIILNYLPKSYNVFIMKYNMNGWEKPISELHGMVKTAEKISQEKSRRTKARTSRESHKLAREKERKLLKTHHPRRRKRLPKMTHALSEELSGIGKGIVLKLKNKKAGEGPSGISFSMIEMGLFTFSSNTWVLDTGCGTHICNSLQGFRKSKDLKENEMVLHVGKGARVTVQALRHFDLCLPSGLNLTLDNVCLITAITRNIILVLRLRKSGNDFKFDDDNIHSLKGIFYFEARPINRIYELNLNDTSNNKSLYHVNTKRPKPDLNQTYLWHCRLGHINRKHISQLQKSGLLGANDIDSFEICESCLCGKMTKSPFFGTSERAIENQLDKTIKILRSDRGGEHLSQEFQDHLRSHRIISQLTPPRTPQLNGVYERRNRTLLYMVRSMMSRITLPLSFWSYALLTAARILNMAPTKKVEKTPYEMWYGRPSSLSYMKVWGCEAYVRKNTSNKTEPRSTKCIFVGYPKDCLGYYFDIPSENKIFISRKDEFLESKFLIYEARGRRVELEED
uniref:Integrase catalytic domain-containing protein n=1 Tax=Lactuca sativa TaxID=4236 RepID=A0A9R1V9L0_LACSA|nr:hypothetical protein LSAT_V11C600316020 [Lactuca sativa]